MWHLSAEQVRGPWQRGGYVGADPGSEWETGPGEKAKASAQGYSKYDAGTLAAKAQGLLAQISDLSSQAGGQEPEIETLKGKVTVLASQAQLFSSSGVGGAAQYQSLLGMYNAYQASYNDILSRVEVVTPEPTPQAPAPKPVAQVKPPSPGTEKSSAAPSGGAAKSSGSGWVWAGAAALAALAVGAKVLKVF